MKQCPQCQRTYADETITFCLVDGAILSAPYADVPPTVEAPPPTVRLPRTTKPQVPETIPAGLPSPQLVRPPMPRSERSGSVYAVIGLAVLLLGGLVTFFVLRARQNNKSQQIANASVSAPTSDRTQSEAKSQEATSNKTTKPIQPASSPSPNRSVAPPKLPAIDVDPKLSPPGARSIPYGVPSSRKSESPTDENKVFNASEVTQKARLLSKPPPSYTQEARKNQVSGTVVLRVVLAASGEVTNITAIKGLPDGLTERAIAAARQIKFVPAMKDGHAVSQFVQVEYSFSLY
jgi:TonB family protein